MISQPPFRPVEEIIDDVMSSVRKWANFSVEDVEILRSRWHEALTLEREARLDLLSTLKLAEEALRGFIGNQNRTVEELFADKFWRKGGFQDYANAMSAISKIKEYLK